MQVSWVCFLFSFNIVSPPTHSHQKPIESLHAQLYDEHHVQNALRLNGLPFDGFSLLGVKTDDPDFMPSGGPAAAAAALHRPAILGVRQPQSYERVAQPTVLVEPRVRRSASWCTLLWEKFM